VCKVSACAEVSTGSVEASKTRIGLLVYGRISDYDVMHCFMCRSMDAEEEAVNGELTALPNVMITAASELAVKRPGTSTLVVLGTRSFQHLYRQHHRPEPYQHVHNHKLLMCSQNLGIPKVSQEEAEKRSQRLRHDRQRDWMHMKSQLQNDKIYKLPKNVPY
jgi:hypothetical protein